MTCIHNVWPGWACQRVEELLKHILSGNILFYHLVFWGVPLWISPTAKSEALNLKLSVNFKNSIKVNFSDTCKKSRRPSTLVWLRGVPWTTWEGVTFYSSRSPIFHKMEVLPLRYIVHDWDECSTSQFSSKMKWNHWFYRHSISSFKGKQVSPKTVLLERIMIRRKSRWNTGKHLMPILCMSFTEIYTYWVIVDYPNSK